MTKPADDRRISLVATDVDGTLTDRGMTYDPAGHVLKRFDVRDGLAVKLLLAARVEVAFVTSDDAGATSKRAERLGVRHCLIGVQDKVAAVQDLCDGIGTTLGETAFLGDDLQDLEVMRAVGLAGAVNDAHALVRDVAEFRCRSKGGCGAFREFAEHVLRLRGDDLEVLLRRIQSHRENVE